MVTGRAVQGLTGRRSWPQCSSSRCRRCGTPAGHPESLDDAITSTRQDAGGAIRHRDGARAGAQLGPAARPRRRRHGDTSSIAVLALSYTIPQHDQYFFCDGIAEEIINALTKVAGAACRRTHVGVRIQGHKQDIRDSGESSMSRPSSKGACGKPGDRLRVTAQLVTSATGITSGRSDTTASSKTCSRSRTRSRVASSRHSGSC